jgi:hypothetical protein
MAESLVAAVDTSHTDLSADTVSEVSEFGAVTEQVRIAVAVAFVLSDMCSMALKLVCAV